MSQVNSARSAMEFRTSLTRKQRLLLPLKDGWGLTLHVAFPSSMHHQRPGDQLLSAFTASGSSSGDGMQSGYLPHNTAVQTQQLDPGQDELMTQGVSIPMAATAPTGSSTCSIPIPTRNQWPHRERFALLSSRPPIDLITPESLTTTFPDHNSASQPLRAEITCPDCNKKYKTQRHFENHVMKNHRSSRYQLMSKVGLTPQSFEFSHEPMDTRAHQFHADDVSIHNADTMDQQGFHDQHASGPSVPGPQDQQFTFERVVVNSPPVGSSQGSALRNNLNGSNIQAPSDHISQSAPAFHTRSGTGQMYECLANIGTWVPDDQPGSFFDANFATQAEDIEQLDHDYVGHYMQ